MIMGMQISDFIKENYELLNYKSVKLLCVEVLIADLNSMSFVMI